MAMLPILLEMVDEVYGTHDTTGTTSGSIPFLYLPKPRAGCPRKHGGGRCGAAKNGCNVRCIENGKCGKQCKPAAHDFQVSLNVKSFKPDEVSVKVKGHEIIVEGKHEEREDETGFISRQFTRRYVLPEEIDMETVATAMDNDGMMKITAQKPKPAVEGLQERIIPIERVASVVEAPTAPVENGDKKKKEYILEDAIE